MYYRPTMERAGVMGDTTGADAVTLTVLQVR
jgi:hypothetical protein